VPDPGHSNVQGNRTCGINHVPTRRFLTARQGLRHYPTREPGLGTVATIRGDATADEVKVSSRRRQLALCTARPFLPPPRRCENCN